MATKSHNIRIDEDIKEQAAALFADLGLNLSTAVNIFLRASLEKDGFPFPVKRYRARFTKELNAEESGARLEEESAWAEAAVQKHSTRTPEERQAALRELLEFARRNPILPKGYKFNREECYDRAIFRR